MGGLGLLLFLSGDTLRGSFRLRGCFGGERLQLRLCCLKGLLCRWFEPRGGTGLLERRLRRGGLGLSCFRGGVMLLDG